MALNFPDSPTLNQVYTDSTSGFSYQWNGTVWISFTPSSTGNIRVLDDISGSFDNTTQTFALTSSTIAISPPNPQSVIVNLGGVVQDPSDDYTISGSNITFTTPPTSGLSFSGVVLGVSVPVGVSTGDVYYRQTYNPTGVQTSFSFVNGYTVGYLDVYQNGAKLVPVTDYTATDGLNFSLITPAQPGDNVEAVGYRVSTVTIVDGSLNSLTVSGISSLAGQTNITNNLSVTGVGTFGTIGVAATALVVQGDARVTGILTVGTSSITLDGSTNTINVGSGVTIDGNTGTINATSFSGDGSGLTGVGVGASDSINTTGIITASTMSANEFVGTGDKLIFKPSITSFSPTDGATGVSALSSPNIVLTYDQLVILGVGTITLRKDSSDGTIVESFEVGVSTRATISNQTLTIDPTNNFDYAQEYYVVVPNGAVTNSIGGNPGTSLTTYNFTAEAGPTLSSVVPADEATSVGVATNITFTFDKDVRAGVGTITLRTTSAGGSIVESYDVSSSARLTFSGSTLTIDPTSLLSYSTTYYVVIPDGAVGGYTGTDTYNFTTGTPQLGDSYEGGFLICQASGTRWIVSPSSAQVSRDWYSRNDANTTAQSVTGCTGWFVPTCGQLQNPGYICRTYWDSYSPANYWASNEYDSARGYVVVFNTGNAYCGNKSFVRCVRAFRCVTY